MFDAFTHKSFEIDKCTIDLLMAGGGPPLLLLHGFPETRAAWHKVAPQLATEYTVILPDLPGYGDSTGPDPDAGQECHTKRAYGNIFVQLMAELGFDTFAVAGHDRGGRVAYRMALDHPEIVSRLAVLNIIPTLEVMERFTFETALKMGNWILLGQPAPLPEQLIGVSPALYLNHILDSWAADPEQITPEARAEYLRCFEKETVIAAMCAEYRCNLLDAEYDRQDRENNRRIQCPLLVLWSAGDNPGGEEDTLSVWKQWADDASGAALPGGHFLMEEAPDPTVQQMFRFFNHTRLPG
ncbi:alpha/beta hydrolase [uncultured Chitinophaga sp.]|jgi:Predicted hydrolases or acyltransferases (alpha/beta hydrolase superfamily)|uniref:alpha/beta fold hydrolase n=1 Tax=uncultured Chitinophaga sp. TaxID=339340 RepID=UPI0026321D4F|nr:alpha/beta hydrolase [uncultured Chitinophaga sp.]